MEKNVIVFEVASNSPEQQHISTTMHEPDHEIDPMSLAAVKICASPAQAMDMELNSAVGPAPYMSCPLSTCT